MIRILAYSDIHHHNYTNGVTLDDTVSVETQVFRAARENKCDLVVFNGDRFLSRNPTTQVRDAADAALRKLNNLDVPIICLVGNHDRITKSPWGGHSLGHVNLYDQDLANIRVLDKRASINLKPNFGLSVGIHAIPAGHPYGEWIETNTQYNILLFHDIVKGCVYSNGIKAEEGIDPDAIDDARYDLILGGDNHHPQDLNFKNTKAMYIGAPMQHNWGDANDVRGFYIIELDNDNPASHTINTKFIPTNSPKFINEEIKLAAITDITEAFNGIGDRWSNNIIKLTLTGASSTLSGLNLRQLQQTLRLSTKARQIRVTTKYTDNVSDPSSVPTQKLSVGDEWRSFVTSKKDDLDNLDIQRIERMGLDYIANADNN